MTDKKVYLGTGQAVCGYNKKIVVDGVNIEIRSGELTVLLGKNGAGKSTLLRSLAGQLELISGKIFILDKNITQYERAELARCMSVLLTDRVHPKLCTCRDIVAMGRYPYTGRLGILSEHDNYVVQNSMELVGIDRLADVDFMSVSDGQQKRVMLARAICQEPELIILDEPTAYLDLRYKLELLGVLRQLAEEKNVAVLMSMHELELAQKAADRVICIMEGRIDRVGEPGEILTSDYVAKLYDMEKGCYDAWLGSIWSAAPSCRPCVFVIGGAGSGIPFYRYLSRRGICFAAGVLHENDVEYRVADQLSRYIVSEKPFFAISDAAVAEAVKYIDICEKVYICTAEWGEGNIKNRELINYAAAQGKICDINCVE